MTANLKEGGITRQLVVLAAPLLFGSVLQQMYNAADSIIIQRFAGDTAFAAAGIAGTVMNLFIFLIVGVCTGVSIVMASLYGGEKLDLLRRESFIATVFGLCFAVILSIVSSLLMMPVLRLICTPDELVPYVRQYLLIIFAGMPATFMYNLCAAALRAVGNTSRATMFLVVAVIANVLLDLLFVGALSMGMAWAALATVLSQVISAALCIVYIIKRQRFILFTREDMRCDRELVRKTVRFSSVSALNQSSLYIGKLLVQGAVDTVSIAAISGFTAGSRIEALANSFGVAGGDAMSVFVAQNLGAGCGKRAREGFKKGVFLIAGMGFVLMALMYLPAHLSVSLFVGGDSPGALREGITYLQLVALFYPICMADCAFLGWNRGSGELDIFMIGTIMQVTIRVAGSWLLAPKIGLAGVAYATGAGWTCLVIFKAIAYFARKKKESF